MFKKFRQRIYNDFNIKKQAEELGVRVWQSPSFLFIVMGIVIVGAMSGVEIISSHYDSPSVLIISECSVVVVLFTIGNFIIKVVEEIAKANKMKSEFVQIASHQLKTPIAEMNWQLELLMSKFKIGLDEQQEDLLKGIANSNQRMGRLVNDLLDVARIDQGQLALTQDKIDFCSLMHEAVENKKQIAEARGVELRDSCPVTPVRLIVDKRRVMVVLDNLLSNAIKYIDGKGVVEIFMEETDHHVKVCVRDNGVGIPSNEQDNIAEKFFRSNNTIKNKTEGTGLGLYITKNIIEQSGGKFWFKSEEGVGSEFYFTLPFERKYDDRHKL